MELEHTGQVMEIKKVLLPVSGLYPPRDSAPDFFQQRQVLLPQVADRLEILILEHDEVANVAALVFVQTQTPVLVV